MTGPLPPRLAAIVEDFASVTPGERLGVLLEYARSFPPLPESWRGRSDLERVPECITPLFVATEVEPGGSVRLIMDAPEEAPTVRAFASLLYHGLDGEAVEVILGVPDDFASGLGLAGVVSPQRMRTLQALLVRIQRQVAHSAARKDGDAMDLEVFVTPGLGDNSFLLVSGDEAVVVDPQRDAWRFLAAAERRSARIRSVLETHVHNDYVSGAHEVQRAVGADIVAPAKGGYAFAHVAAEEGVEIAIGDLVLRAWETPGHTYEHISWAVHRSGDGAVPLAVFSGGSLLVGSAGRTDLLGPEHTDALTRLQFETMQRFRDLPVDVQVLPTHGAGSFCVSTLPSAERTSSMAAEFQHNNALIAPDGASFSHQQLTGLMEYPRYYPFMAPINRTVPTVFGSTPRPPRVDAEGLERVRAAGAVLVDARDREEFAAGHIPGSLNIELNEGFGTYVGWVTPFDSEIVLVLPDREDAEAEAVTQLIRVGYDRIVGVLDGGFAAWTGAGREARTYPVGTTKELKARLAAGEDTAILDVRQPGEWNSEGIIPGSTRIFVGDLVDRIDSLPRDREFWIFCTNGHRASIAASMLDAAGIPARLIAKSGVLGLLDHLEPFTAADQPA